MKAQQHPRISIAICTPQPYTRGRDGSIMLDTITVNWQRARAGLSVPTNFNSIEMFADGMEVGDARNKVALKCLESSPPPEFLFFIDNDVLIPHDALTKLYFRAQTRPGYDIYCGVYCCKWTTPCEPLIYAGDGGGPYWDWAVGDLLTTEEHGITSVHMGLTLIRTSLFKRMVEAGYGAEKPMFYSRCEKTVTDKGELKTARGTEDIYFCQIAVNDFDAKILVDTGVLAGHIDKSTGKIWGLEATSPPIQRARRLYAGQPGGPAAIPELVALDLGAGNSRRVWEGYKTETLDIRKESGADYIQDARMMTFRDNTFDLVASSHHLEHIGRLDQDLVWAEMFRVCKPGGGIEHIIPDVSWAAHQIEQGIADDHVLNVLYGAQEAYGYAREFNLHYFGYTPELAISFAKKHGFVDVTCKNWKDDPALDYNMILTGFKPGAKEERAKEIEILQLTPRKRKKKK
jgi:hypothetical protein